MIVVKDDLVEKLVEHINQSLEAEFKEKLKALYLVGSYTQGNISLSRPDINWVLIWKDLYSAKDVWKLGEILTSSIDRFAEDMVVRPEFRPFKFSYPARKGVNDVFVNISSAFASNSSANFKKKNSYIPEYVWAGFKLSRKLVFGKDLLANIEFEITRESVMATALQKIMSHKIQLERIPLTYHLKKDIDLVFNESLSHGKNLLYFAAEMLMSDNELQDNLYLNLLKDKKKLLNFFSERFPEVKEIGETIMESRQSYSEWKSLEGKAKNLYNASYNLSELLLKMV